MEGEEIIFYTDHFQITGAAMKLISDAPTSSPVDIPPFRIHSHFLGDWTATPELRLFQYPDCNDTERIQCQVNLLLN